MWHTSFKWVLHTAIAFWVFAWAGEAQAAFPCTWAPGEVQVGDDRGTPLCEQRGDPNAPPPPQMAWVDNHFAIAAHPDAADMWVAIGYPNGASAQQAAVAACNQDMGTGCQFMITSYNSSYSIGIGATGRVYTNWDSSAAKAKKRMLAECRKIGDVCVETSHGTASPGRKIAGSASNYNREIWRPTGNFRHQFASAAWVEPNDQGGSNDVWIATGYRSAQEAENAALQSCMHDSGHSCAAARTVASVFLYIAQTKDGEIRLGSSPTEKMAQSIMRANCGKSAKCKLVALYNPWKSGLIRFRPTPNVRN